MRKASALALSMTLLCCSAAFADNATSRLDDAGVTTKVKSALITNKDTKASQINVETSGGVVQLSGFVDSQAAKQAAETTAANVSGVKDVQNNLEIRDGKRSTGVAVDDTVIAAKVKSEIAGKSGAGSATAVNVEVNRGIVSLSGFVSTPDQKSQAAQIARGVNGVVDVRNNIELKPKS